MRPRHQNGQLEIRSDGKGKYYSGRYTIYVKDQDGKDVRTQPRAFLGYCSEIDEAEAVYRLQKLIRKSRTTSPDEMNEINLQFWNQQLHDQPSDGPEPSMNIGEIIRVLECFRTEWLPNPTEEASFRRVRSQTRRIMAEVAPIIAMPALLDILLQILEDVLVKVAEDRADAKDSSLPAGNDNQ